jgi:hypothetical protein
MSYRIGISFVAVAIGISCIATEASARGRGGSAPLASANKSISPGGTVTTIRKTVGAGGPAGGGTTGSTVGGPAGATSGGAAGGARYYAPASYTSNTACGRYPYPPCNKRMP